MSMQRLYSLIIGIIIFIITSFGYNIIDIDTLFFGCALLLNCFP